MKIETGVMVMKDGKAWGRAYYDGQISAYGWIDPEIAPIHDPEYVKVPTDVLYKGHSAMTEVAGAKLVKVRRVTRVEIELLGVSMGPYPATRTVHCSSGPVHCCTTHATDLANLMRFMGGHVNMTAAPAGAQCSNCENEAKAKEKVK